MPADPFTPAELDAACDAVKAAGPYAVPVDYARAVLSAVAPLIAARVRAEAREAVAQAIQAHAGSERVAPAGHRAYTHAAYIARAHRTIPTGEDHPQ